MNSKESGADKYLRHSDNLLVIIHSYGNVCKRLAMVVLSLYVADVADDDYWRNTRLS